MVNIIKLFWMKKPKIKKIEFFMLKNYLSQNLKWKQLKCNGDVPTPRSGHSFTHVGGFNYLLYGGIDNSKKGGKILPCNDVFTMKIGTSKYFL